MEPRLIQLDVSTLQLEHVSLNKLFPKNQENTQATIYLNQVNEVSYLPIASKKASYELR
jgi:hypothetical protein